MTAEKMNKWESQGVGKAPFKVVGVATIPSLSLAEANPEAYNNALRELPRGYRLGTCHVCGRGISVNYLIHDADGARLAVGSDCVTKTGDTILIAQVKRIKSEADRLKRDLARAARQQAYMDAKAKREEEALQEQRGRNNGLTDAEVARAQAARRAEILIPVSVYLHDGNGGFRDSVAADMQIGRVPTGRGRAITLDILAKMAGRGGSKAYNSEYDRIDALFDAATAI